MTAAQRFFKRSQHAPLHGMNTWLSIAVLGLSVLLGSCGKKGPLTLPEDAPSAESAAFKPSASQPQQETP